MEITGINFYLQKEMDSQVEVMEAIKKLKDLEKPSVFENEVKNLDMNSYEKDKLGIFFSDEGEEEYLAIDFSQTHEAALHIHIYVEKDNLDDTKKFIEKSLQNVGELQVNILNIGFRLEETVGALGFNEEYKGDKIISYEVEKEEGTYKFERRDQGTYIEFSIEDENISSLENYVKDKKEISESYLGDILAE
jgi:hypothetical protein